MTNQDGYRVDEAADLTGTTPETLRMWEHRYGWPSPRRAANGYRCFSEGDIIAIRRFAALLAQGFKHSELIVEGMPCWPARKAAPDLAQLLELRSPSARAAATNSLNQIRRAIATRDGRALMQLLVEVACLVHPLDRIGAGWLPALLGLVAWEAVDRPMPGAGEAWRFIRDQVGAATLATLMERARTEPPKEEG